MPYKVVNIAPKLDTEDTSCWRYDSLLMRDGELDSEGGGFASVGVTKGPAKVAKLDIGVFYTLTCEETRALINELIYARDIADQINALKELPSEG